MRLGGAIPGPFVSVEKWIGEVKAIGYSAAQFPLKPGADRSLINECVAAMQEAGVLNAEVGAWSNPLAPNKEERETAIAYNIAALELAEETGAVCCVNIAGAVGPQWDGPYAENLTEETYDRIVENTRFIIDRVRPKRTKYSLEAMPWAYPDSPASYVELIGAIDREGFGIHLDICNMVNSPRRYFFLDDLIDECFDLLGDRILSLHLKDILLSGKLTTHLDEVLPGEGKMNFARIFEHAAKLPADMPMIIEHLQTLDEYNRAYRHLKGVLEQNDLMKYVV